MLKKIVTFIFSLIFIFALFFDGWACAKPAPSPALAPATKPATAPTGAPAPAATPKPAQLPRAIVFGCQPIGTNTYIIATGLATVIQKFTGIKVIVQPMSTTALLYNELDAGRMDLALMTQAGSYVALRGEEAYKELGPKQINQLGCGSAGAYFWVTRPDTGIKSVKDMAGKKIAYQTAVDPSRTEVWRLALEYYGVADKVIGINRVSMDAAANDLVQKRIDGIGGPLGSFAYSLKESCGIVIISMGGAEVSKYIAQKRPDFTASAMVGTYPAGYFTLPEKMDTLSSFKEITVSPRMPHEVAYAVTKAIYDHPEDTAAIHRDVGEFNLEQALKPGLVIPTHPGAIKYYREKGMWTKELDDQQQKLIALQKEMASKKK